MKQNQKEVAETKYWWHFKKEGCLGLTRIANFGGSGGGGPVFTIDITPQTVFLSAGPHLAALLDELARNDYKASAEWIAHFRKYSGLLFMDFYKKAKSIPKN